MGKSLIIKGADFSANAVYASYDIELYLAANSSATVTFNIDGTHYNPNVTYPSRIVATVINSNDYDDWVGLNIKDYVSGELIGASGMFSKQNGDFPDQKAIKKVKINKNVYLPGATSTNGVFASFYSGTQNLTEVIWGSGYAPYNCIFDGDLELLDLSHISKIIYDSIGYANKSFNVLNLSNCIGISPSLVSLTQFKLINNFAPNKIIVNNVSSEVISDIITVTRKNYTLSVDSDGNTVLLKQ